jgi:hypothetical protein
MAAREHFNGEELSVPLVLSETPSPAVQWRQSSQDLGSKPGG